MELYFSDFHKVISNMQISPKNFYWPRGYFLMQQLKMCSISFRFQNILVCVGDDFQVEREVMQKLNKQVEDLQKKITENVS